MPPEDVVNCTTDADRAVGHEDVCSCSDGSVHYSRAAAEAHQSALDAESAADSPPYDCSDRIN
jgi:hypothetical protein